ncbi:hypothetical protein O181_099585 [Austropuccinia psidii MF-1]|uniref:Uncharacterized protein n=1 Tax=Austropuccinia psidii MF-1 TaxID=1389203 RepID=A0A9Q3JDX2_9BASI|nr:hypothetical protein [Austropuccinia psidii MF-1]
MVEITPINQRFQNGLTGKGPFDQIPQSQEDDKYYEDPLQCNSICGRPQRANNKNKNKNKIEFPRFEIIESQSKRRGRPQSKIDQHNNIKITVNCTLSNYGSGFI